MARMRTALGYLLLCYISSVLAQQGQSGEASSDGSVGGTGLQGSADPQALFEMHKSKLSAAMTAFRAALAAEGPAPQRYEQRLKRHTKGILIAGGGERHFVNALASMRVIRDIHGSTLPITFAYYGEEEYVPWLAAEMKALKGVHLKDVSQHPLPAIFERDDADMDELLENGFFRKVLGIYNAPYSEIMYLDSDSVPLAFPDDLFGSPHYVLPGNLFFPEVWKEGVRESPMKECYELLGLEAPWLKGPWGGVESGQFLFNMDQHRDVLDWVLFLNSHHDILYSSKPRYTYGDKDIFEMGFMLAEKETSFSRSPILPRLAMQDSSTLAASVADGTYRTVGQIHVSDKGMPLYLHRVAANKLELDKPIWETARAVVFTTPVTFELTHNHLAWTEYGHMLPPAVMNVTLDCDSVDDWVLRAWQENPSWIPRRREEALKTCLAAWNASAASSLAAKNKEMAVPIPVESFGEEVVMALDHQLSTLAFLKLRQEHLKAKESLGGGESKVEEGRVDRIKLRILAAKKLTHL